MLIEQMQNQLKPEYSFRYIHQPQLEFTNPAAADGVC